MSDPITIGISSASLLGVVFGAGMYVADMRNMKARLAEEKAAREKTEEKLEAKVDACRGEKDRRVDKVEERIDRLETDLSEKMDAAVAEIRGIVSGFAAKLAEMASEVRVLDKTKASVQRMPAQRDPRREE